MEKLHIKEVIVVEGRYDAAALANLVDGLIITTNGFSIFKDDEKKELIRRLGKQRGILILTDSDAAGFSIRNYVEKIAGGCSVKHAYIPALKGKEKRKAAPSKEGTLGVEGLPPQTLVKALENAGIAPAEGQKNGAEEITPTHLYTLGLSGGQGSAQLRRAVLASLGLPPRLSKNAMCCVLSSLYTYADLQQAVEDCKAKI